MARAAAWLRVNDAARARAPPALILTLYVVVRFAARDPFPALEAPVVRVREHDLHEHVVVRAHVQPRDVEAQEREHAPARDTTTG